MATSSKPGNKPGSTGRSPERAAPKSTVSKQEGAVPRLRIRMYRHGLGDCLLLRFARPQAENTFNLLIDCGLITIAPQSKDTMIRVAKDIKTACNNRLDVVVLTHEHWDHVSGFSSQQAREVFEDVEIGEVWYGWTEDPQNDLGKRLRKERADKVSALAKAVTALSRSPNPMAVSRSQGLASTLGFFGMDLAAAGAEGATIGKTRDAFDCLTKRSDVKTRYCYPDKPPLPLGNVENVRVFVLGPPQDEALIKKSAPTKSGREVYELASESNLAAHLEAAFVRLNGVSDPSSSGYEDCPFDVALRKMRLGGPSRTSEALDALIQDTWDKPGEEWRRIEDDWTQIAETLALNLDTHTNNTGLVLAFEFVDTGEVFLFPGDAQVGNWLSWQQLKWRIRSASGSSEVTGPELLSRTVFYKVGHHGSHNATLRSFGLEQMTSEELIAFIPVFKEQAEKNRWMSMPFEPLVKRLREKTAGRLLQSDKAPPNRNELNALPGKAQNRFLSSTVVGPAELYFEYSFEE